MDSIIYDSLKEACSEKTININGEDKSLLDIVVDWEDGFTRTKNVNEDLKSQRDEWKETKRKLNEQLADYEKAKTELEEKLNSVNGKASSKANELSAKDKQILELTQRIEQMNNSLEEMQKRATENEERAKNITMQSALEKMRNDVITELGKYGITGNQSDLAWTAIVSKGFAKIVDTNDEIKTIFSITKDNKELATDIAGMCREFAEQNKYLVSPSGNKGAGEVHKSNTPSSANKGNYFNMIQGVLDNE